MTNPLADISHEDSNCGDCGVDLTGDDNASAYGDNMNVCDRCEGKREHQEYVKSDYAGYCEGCSHLTHERVPLVLDWDTQRRDYCADCLEIIQEDRRQEESEDYAFDDA